jgi:hypothetical protein
MPTINCPNPAAMMVAAIGAYYIRTGTNVIPEHDPANRSLGDACCLKTSPL